MPPSTPNTDAIFEALVADRNNPAALRKRIETLELLLERSFTIPGINRPVGLDAIVGLVPVVGDVVTAVMGAYIIWEARNLGMPKWKLWRMMGNLGVDTALGAIPLVGDAFDFLFRSNTRNLRIIRKHLDKHHPGTIVIDQ
ncbi:MULTISPECIES: DUF4112 domain-containing protein [Sphingopyxis]|jgi:hypothetical protein|uniref:DUF4112 domain-containing protein n=1 Tax=Sphingopyxis terrae subsp. terrae NBRC 15098 TaxID=1219058 RepID=A0A142W220_9SPHN|nr:MULTISPECIES: DUF4112 domain-containing protein [Sphingopyxis]MBD3746372.1 DUF4112 domain-containing protein [Sphingopyxis terrae]AMU96098.1 hypothetical protein AOA14_15945 [Sphingopyxis terrae subsp. terrae NBRC 15098]ENY81255.1 hypothetical protein EBMC1_09384 [Sphingopyxis sp. MC1]MBU7589600.1 DUF4112 domain-containing protein [Sphingopyxis terrae]QXF12234.1 DUF4112 domain-containing protein [Sphingopyxis terrae subsp. terrae]